MTGPSPAVQWVTPSPLWPAAAADPATMQRPTILRFASDEFMPELASVLAVEPAGLADRVAEPRSYRPRPPGTTGTWAPALPELKLFQAAHGHFNLIAASLVCRLNGLPERTLDATAEESVGFVLRRLVATEGTTLAETAWVDDPVAGKGWRSVAGREKRIADGEEILPLFPVNYVDGRPRRLFVGLIPTSSADTFKAAGALSPLVDEDPPGTPFDARIDDFETRVLAPLAELRTAGLTPADATSAERPVFDAAALELRREASRFLLLDFAELLATHMPTVWSALGAGSQPVPGPERDLYLFLDESAAGRAGSMSLRSALLAAWAQRLEIAGEAEAGQLLAVDLKGSTFSLDTLRSRFRLALPATPTAGSQPAAEPAVGGPDEIPKLDPSGGSLFVVRCVFRRPMCRPPIDVVGEPSRRFAIASFFDVDAPARSIRVQLPVRTSIADLRKYPRNVGFVLSDQLREQMTRVTDLKRVMESELADGESFDVGLLCSFSIPIITICALIVLMIFVSLLNIVFWWMPFLRICLPIAISGKRA